MMNDNAFFEDMKRIGSEWESARRERQERKQRIIDEYGWDSAEMEAWYAEDKAVAFPFAGGEIKAYRAYVSSVSRQQDEIEMDDFLWDREVGEFVETLRRAGVQTFVYTNQSTAVMENLHGFEAAGCTLDSLCTAVRYEYRWGADERTEVLGIRFRLN